MNTTSNRNSSVKDMKHSRRHPWGYTLMASVALSGIVAIALGPHTSKAQTPTPKPNPRVELPPKRTDPKAQVPINASLTIGEVRPSTPGDPLVEHDTVLAVPVTVQLKPSLGGAKSGPIDTFLCAADQQGNCSNRSVVRFPQLTSDAPVSTTLHVTAPTAGAHSKLRVNLCQQPASGDTSTGDQLLASAESQEMRVAARYVVALRDINAFKITSPHSDTLFIGLQATLKGSSPECTSETCKQGSPDPSHYPNEMYSPTDETAGRHYPAGMFVGPFTLVPESDPDIVVSFGVFNFGAGYNQATSSSLRHTITSLLSAARIFSWDVNETMRRLNVLGGANPPHWNGCDGPLAAGSFVLRNNGPGDTIATNTNDGQAWQDPSTKEIYTGSPRSDECEVSRYRVTLNVERISKP
jgi:hypothetical protein